MLEQAAKDIKWIYTRGCDIADPDDRNSLFERVRREFSEMDIHVNNARVQRDINLIKGTSESDMDETWINFQEAGIIMEYRLSAEWQQTRTIFKAERTSVMRHTRNGTQP